MFLVKFILSSMLLGIVFINEASSMNATSPPPVECKSRTTCDSCVSNSTCLWCNDPQKCMVYPASHVLPGSDDCSLSAARWGVCWLNFEAMIISLSVIGGVLLIGLALCICKCCKCCCFKRNEAKYQAEEMRLERERQERSMRHDQRKQERQRRNDDIRRKYGLVTGDNNRYQRFEDDAA